MKLAIKPTKSRTEIRIPEQILESCNLGSDVDVQIRDRELVIRPRDPHAGWEESARLMVKNGDDEILLGDNDAITEWDNL